MRGYTLVELLLTMLLVGILGGLAADRFLGDGDAARFEATRAKMETIRAAILGDGTSAFGYHGDVGRLPPTLEALVAADVPLYRDGGDKGGAGWRGPYLTIGFRGDSVGADGWGRPFVWSPGASPPTLVSYGADGVPGGTGYAQDLTAEFPVRERIAVVRGYVRRAEKAVAGAKVELSRPSAGALEAVFAVTDANGYFEVSGVPFGVRSISGVAPQTAARRIVVNRFDVALAPGALNASSTEAKP